MKILISLIIGVTAACLPASSQLTIDEHSPSLEGCIKMIEAPHAMIIPVFCDGTATNNGWKVAAYLRADKTNEWKIGLLNTHSSDTMFLRLGESSNGVTFKRIRMTNNTTIVTIDSDDKK